MAAKKQKLYSTVAAVFFIQVSNKRELPKFAQQFLTQCDGLPYFYIAALNSKSFTSQSLQVAIQNW